MVGALLGRVPRAGVPMWAIREPRPSLGGRLHPHQAKGGEFGERKCPSPGNPRALSHQGQLAAVGPWSLLPSPAVPQPVCHWVGAWARLPN